MELKNKRVLVVGLGKSGMAAALFLRDQGARVTVSDTRSAVALASEIPALLDAGIMVETGGHGLLTFRRQDLIVVSPGVPFDTPELKQVRAYGRWAADHRRAGAGEPVSAGARWWRSRGRMGRRRRLRCWARSLRTRAGRRWWAGTLGRR